MADLLKRSSIDTNPDIFTYPTSTDIKITSHGTYVYWMVCAVMAASTIGFLAWGSRVHRSKRVFHYITALITFVACIAYFTMASNLGYASIGVEFQRSDPKVAGLTREIFYVRYIDWVVTTPLLLLDLLLTAGLPWPTILATLLVDEAMIVTGLVGALVVSSYKWGYFVFAMIALFYIAWNFWVGRKYAYKINAHVGKTFQLTGLWTIGLWFIYPIAWGLSEGGNVISADSEAAFYAVLDILAKPGFGFLLLWFHQSIDPAILGIHIRDYDEVPVGGYGLTHHGEKTNENAPTSSALGHSNGAGHVNGSDQAYSSGANTTGHQTNTGHQNVPAAGTQTAV